MSPMEKALQPLSEIQTLAQELPHYAQTQGSRELLTKCQAKILQALNRVRAVLEEMSPSSSGPPPVTPLPALPIDAPPKKKDVKP